MLIHILQGLLVIILLASPFAIERLGLKDAALDYHISNMRATVDSGIIQYYSNYGSLPDTLDAEVLNKMGLTPEDTEGMTYEKLSDREFSLTSPNANNSYSFSTNSFRELPVSSTATEEVEALERYALSVAATEHQQITVGTTLPDGRPGSVLRNGASLELPKGTLFTANVLAEEGYLPGTLSPKEGRLQGATHIGATDAQLKTYNLSVDVPAALDSHQRILVKVEDTKTGQQAQLSNGEKLKVGHGSAFTAQVQPAEPGWLPGTLNHTAGVIKDHTSITVTEATRQTFTISMGNPAHQKLTATIVDSATGKSHYLTNGDRLVAPYGSTVRAEVTAEAGYTAGNLTGVPANGVLKENTVISATQAVRGDIIEPGIVDGIRYYVMDFGYSHRYAEWKDSCHTAFDGNSINYDALYNREQFDLSKNCRRGKILTGPDTHYLLARFSSGSWRRLRTDYLFSIDDKPLFRRDKLSQWDELTKFFSDYRCLIKVEPNTVYSLAYRDLDTLLGDEESYYQAFQVVVRDAPTQDVKVLSSTEAAYLQSIQMPGNTVADELAYFYPGGRMLLFDVTK